MFKIIVGLGLIFIPIGVAFAFKVGIIPVLTAYGIVGAIIAGILLILKGALEHGNGQVQSKSRRSTGRGSS